MQRPDLSLRYHVEIRYRFDGELQEWEVHRAYSEYQDAEEGWWVLRRRNFSRANIRIRDTQLPEGQQIIYP